MGGGEKVEGKAGSRIGLGATRKGWEEDVAVGAEVGMSGAGRGG